jgi:hypothetical protein
MVRSTGPRHDWVFLTRDELRTLERMERSLTADVDEHGDGPQKPSTLRSHALVRLRRMAFVPLLLVLGLAVLVDGVFRSAFEAGAGAVLVVLGMAACFWWGWRRPRRAGSSG